MASEKSLDEALIVVCLGTRLGLSAARFDFGGGVESFGVNDEKHLVSSAINR